MPKALEGTALLDYLLELKADPTTTERDRIILVTIARAGRVPTAAALAKMCGGVRGISARLVEQTLTKHAGRVAQWSARPSA